MLRTALVGGLSAVHEESGCLKYALHESDETFILIEHWATQADLIRHGDGANVTRMASAIKGWLAEPVRIQAVTPIHGGEPLKGRI